MINRIKQAIQPKNENIIEFDYYSGVKRYSYLDGSYFRMTETQRTFINQLSEVIECVDGTIWIRKQCYTI